MFTYFLLSSKKNQKNLEVSFVGITRFFPFNPSQVKYSLPKRLKLWADKRIIIYHLNGYPARALSPTFTLIPLIFIFFSCMISPLVGQPVSLPARSKRRRKSGCRHLYFKKKKKKKKMKKSMFICSASYSTKALNFSQNTGHSHPFATDVW